MSWRTSSYSTADGTCVAIATPDPATVLVRNSNHPERGTITLRADAVSAFVAACRAGELDDLTA